MVASADRAAVKALVQQPAQGCWAPVADGKPNQVIPERWVACRPIFIF
jgi:hypothetical protein